MSTFQVDLRGMVDLLSRNLYSGPRVYVRELLQNAVDAIAARRALEPGCPQRVVIGLGRADGAATLTCTDTGIGLTAGEVDELLSTIGASSKRDELGLARGDYLGQFGIGLLSCFMVSPEIVVTSRSARGTGAGGPAAADGPGGPGVRWRGRTDGTYVVEPVVGPADDVPRGPGTTIALRALPSESWLAPETVRALVEEFGHLLPVDIEVRSDDGAVTRHGRGRGPWEMTRGQAVRWCAEELGSEPFDLLDLDVPAAGLHGTIAVMGQAAPTTAARHTVSVKRMLVTRAAEGLAPDWAYFVRVVADAEHLRLTASRESLVDDDLLASVREAIGKQVRGWIDRLGRAAPTRLNAFVAAHAVGLCSVAVEALKAGNDVLLGPSQPQQAREDILQAIRRGEVSLASIEEKCRRILAFKFALIIKKKAKEASPADVKELIWTKEEEALRTQLWRVSTASGEGTDPTAKTTAIHSRAGA